MDSATQRQGRPGSPSRFWYHDKPMMQSRRSNQSVSHGKWPSGEMTSPAQNPPTLRDALRNRQHSSRERGQQTCIEPLFQVCTAFARGRIAKPLRSSPIVMTLRKSESRSWLKTHSDTAESDRRLSIQRRRLCRARTRS